MENINKEMLKEKEISRLEHMIGMCAQRKEMAEQEYNSIVEKEDEEAILHRMLLDALQKYQINDKNK